MQATCKARNLYQMNGLHALTGDAKFIILSYILKVIEMRA